MNIQKSIALSAAAFTIAIIVSRWQQPMQIHPDHSTTVVPHATYQQPRLETIGVSDIENFVDVTIPPAIAQSMLTELKGVLDNGKLASRYYPKTRREPLTTANSYLPEEVAIPLHSKVSNALSIDIDHRRLAEVHAGDIISMVLPSGDNIDIQITHSRPTVSGAQQMTGYAIEYGKDYPVLITTLDNFTTATIPTPVGEYILEALNGKGWIYQPPNLNELITADSTDTLLPILNKG